MTSDDWWAFGSGVLILAILFVLVKPGSNGASAVQDIGKALVSLVAASVA